MQVIGNKPMHDIVFDSDFDLENTNEYILSIQVSLDGFSFFIIHQQNKKILAFKNTILKISNENLLSRHFNDWLKSEEVFIRPFAQKFIIVFSATFSIIPETYFQIDEKNTILPTLFEDVKNLEIEKNFIESINSQLLFAFPKQLNVIIKQHFNSYKIIHPLQLIITSQIEKNTPNSIILLVDSKSFYTAVFKENRLLFCNSFSSSNVNDIQFYILSTLKQLFLSPGQLHLYLCGNIKQGCKTEQTLQPYFYRTSYLTPSTNYDNMEGIDESIHQNISLFI